MSKAEPRKPQILEASPLRLGSYNLGFRILQFRVEGLGSYNLGLRV